jgi:hypothetical protein
LRDQFAWDGEARTFVGGGIAIRFPHDPGTPAHAKWMEGWHAGQESLMTSFQKMPVDDEPAPAAPADEAVLEAAQ